MVKAKLEQNDVPIFRPETRKLLIFDGKQLEDEKTLCEYNIGHESILYEEMRLCGGPCLVCKKCPCECKKGNNELCSEVVKVWYRFWDI